MKEDANWLIGLGLGNLKSSLNSCYIENGEKYLAGISYNTHNQYLHTWLNTGIIGFILLLFNFFIVPSIAIKQKDLFKFSFIVFFALCCLTESMLAVQKGVVFFAFFNSFLAFSNSKQSNIE